MRTWNDVEEDYHTRNGPDMPGEWWIPIKVEFQDGEVKINRCGKFKWKLPHNEKRIKRWQWLNKQEKEEWKKTKHLLLKEKEENSKPNESKAIDL